MRGMLMNLRRLSLVCRLELAHNLRRPLFWIMIAIILLTAWGLSTGHMRIRSGDDTVGGNKAWITSEFAIAMVLPILVFLYYSFFLAVAAGMTVIRDDELRVSELLHATPLRPGEYVWGKFLAVLVSFLAVLAIHLTGTAFFNHLVPSAAAVELRGPFHAWNYIHPALIFALPAIVFLGVRRFGLGCGAARPSWSSFCRWRCCWLVFSCSGIGRRPGWTRASTGP
jgi:ABC-2 type transport system permease protein